MAAAAIPRYDAVVVGAGPAGGIAALRLSSAGTRVLLLERRRLGRDKPCGGGLTSRAWQGLEVDVGDLVRARTGVAELRCGLRRAVRVGLGARPVWMVRRRDLDRRITLAAVAAGAELHDEETVTGLAPDPTGVTVSSTHGRYRAETLLLATGAEAPLRDQIGLGPAAPVMGVALEVEAPARADHLDQDTFVFDYALPGGYGWAFPKGDWWNAGVVTFSRGEAPRLRSRLAALIEQLGIRFDLPGAAVRHAQGRRIPVGGGRSRRSAGRTALLGDAAALADPLFGEGIAEAMLSGRAAATAVLRVLDGTQPDLGGYQAALERATAPHRRRTALAARAVYAAPALAVGVLRLPPCRDVARRLATAPFRHVDRRPGAPVGAARW